MGGPSRAPLPRFPLTQAQEQEARNLLTRAQAALLDEQRGAALRSLASLHHLLVPLVDEALAALASSRSRSGVTDTNDKAADRVERGPSCAVGFLGLWRDLPDLDAERESLPELLLFHAAQQEDSGPEQQADAYDPLGAMPLDGWLEAQWTGIEQRLLEAPMPRSRWWRRLVRGASGLGDLARVQVQRGPVIVMERLPAGADAGAPIAETAETAETAAVSSGDNEAPLFSSQLAEFQSGDRLVLQVPVPVPGRVAVLHAAGDPFVAELFVLLPQHPGEEAPRRAHEIVEVVGELQPVAGASEHSLIVIWVPEVVPPSWLQGALHLRRLPPEARTWRYRYAIK